MEKKEFPKKQADQKKNPDSKSKTESKISGKLKWISDRAADIIKLILGICLLPFVYSSAKSFLIQISNVNNSLQNCFWTGVLTLILIHLFIWEPAAIYNGGHKLLEIVFNFFQPLVKVAPYLLPIYTIVAFIVYGLLSLFIKENWLIQYAMFIFGLSIALHLIFASRTLRSKKGDILMSNYIFGFSFIFIINLGLLSFLLSLMLNDYSFIKYSNYTYSLAVEIFRAFFSQLFLV